MHKIVDRGPGETAATIVYGSAKESNSPAFVDRAPRIALLVFLVISAVSFFLAIVWGSQLSFWVDEWSFLAARDAGSIDSLLKPHNGHWVMLPILAYRALWSVFGMHTYLPYQLLSISMHLMAAGLLRAVMRRSDTAPWIATFAAGLFALFGSGANNILVGFQITLVGSLVFGLVQLLLADHNGPVGWRDCLAAAAGLASLMCSGFGVAMVFIVGFSVLLKRGWSRALLQTVPLALVFILWWIVYGQDALGVFRSTPQQILLFVVSGVVGTFQAIGQVHGMEFLLAAVILLGLVTTWQSSRSYGLRYHFQVPVAFAFGSLVFLVTSGYGRAVFGPDVARASRFVDLGAAMWLPIIAAAATAVARRWRIASVAMLSLFLIGLAGNTKRLSDFESEMYGDPGAMAKLVQALAYSDLLEGVPGDTRPFPEAAKDLSTAWLAEETRLGRIPEPEAISKATREKLRFRLSFVRRTREIMRESCEVLVTPIDRDLEAGDQVIMKSLLLKIEDRSTEATKGHLIQFKADLTDRVGNTIDVLAPVKVRLTSTPTPQIMICH